MAPTITAATGPDGSRQPLLSDDWYRVAELRPRLAEAVAVERVAYRGHAHRLLVLPPSPADGRGAGPRRIRVDAAAWAFLGRLDGARTVDHAWQEMVRGEGDAAATQDEAMELLLRLYRAGALAMGQAPDFGLLSPTRGGGPATPRTHRSTWLALRMPLGNPDAWLERLRPVAHGLFQPLAWAVWAMGMGALCVLAVAMAPAWQDYFSRWARSPHVALAGVLAFVLLKALHELAHGLAVKRHGGRVPQWGLTWMLGFPMPWVDASAADGFASRYARLMVSSAGLAAELGVACLAMFLAWLVQPGLVRDVSLTVVLLAAVNSVMVNANPLMRFDGYHALTDWLDLPNLATRSSAWWLWRLHALLGLRPAPLPAPLPHEWRWWVGYAPAALVCRWVIAFGLIFWAGAWAASLGWALAAYFGFVLVLRPLGKAIRFLWAADQVDRVARRARRRALAAASVVVVAVGLLPWPDATAVRGVVWLPDEAAVRAGEAGFISSVAVQDGQRVRQGEVLLRLDDLALPAERARLASRLAGIQAERLSAMSEDPARWQRLEAELQAQELALQRLDERLGAWELKAPHDGIVSLSHGRDAVGRHVERGQVLAQVLPRTALDPGEGEVRVRVAVDAQIPAERLHAAQAVAVTRAGDASAWPARVRPGSAQAAASRQLPSAALGDRFGGGLVTEPEDLKGERARHPVWVLDVVVAPIRLDERGEAHLAQQMGPTGPQAQRPWHWRERVWVRFDHGHQPLLWQALRAAQQAALLHFAPGA